MPEGTATGLWILLALIVAIVLIAGLTAALRKGDEEEHDIEHLDHETHGDSHTH